MIKSRLAPGKSGFLVSAHIYHIGNYIKKVLYQQVYFS